MSQYDLLLGSGQLECFLPSLAFFVPWGIDNTNRLDATNIIGGFIYFISVVLKVIVCRLMLTVISMHCDENDNKFLLDCFQTSLENQWIVAGCRTKDSCSFKL